MGAQAQIGFDEKWVGEEAEERADVGEGVEAVGRNAGRGFCVPVLKQRAGGGEQEKGKADGGGQEGEDGKGWVQGLRGARGEIGSDGRGPEAREDGESGDGDGEENDLDGGLAAHGEICGDGVGVDVAGEKGELEKEEAGGPDGGSAAEDGEDLFAEEELDLEEEEGGEEDGRGEGECGGRARFW